MKPDLFITGPRRRILDGVFIISGLLLFAAFIHRHNALRVIAFSGLLFSAIAIHLVSRKKSILRIAGLLPVQSGLLLYVAAGLLLGSSLGILARIVFKIPPIPDTLTNIALVAPLIGIGEEIIFRGFLQGYIRPGGRIFAMLFATAAHTIYKIIVIYSLPDPVMIDYRFLLIWTFLGGLIFALLRDLSKSVIPPALAHGCFDILLYGGFTVMPAWVWS